MNKISLNIFHRFGNGSEKLASALFAATGVLFLAAFMSKSGAVPTLAPAEIALPIVALLSFATIAFGFVVTGIEHKVKRG